MPAVVLSADEVGPGILPPICMVCGGSAEGTRPVGFSWVPAWTYFLLLAGFWPFALVYLLARRQMTVSAPVCHRHRRYWLVRRLVLPVGLVVTLAVMFAPVLVEPPVARYPTWAWAGAAAVFVTTVVAAVWLRLTGARVVAMSRDRVAVAGVAPEFVAAVGAGRADFERREREWLERYERKADGGRV